MWSVCKSEKGSRGASQPSAPSLHAGTGQLCRGARARCGSEAQPCALRSTVHRVWSIAVRWDQVCREDEPTCTSATHQGILSVEGLCLDLSSLAVTSNNRRNKLGCIISDDFFVGHEGGEVSDRLTGIIGDHNGNLLGFSPGSLGDALRDAAPNTSSRAQR
jgi:hypothetical protein